MDSASVRVVRRIGDVTAAAWDAVAGDDVYARHGWLRTVEETVTEAADPVYFLGDGDGRLDGAAIAYRLAGATPSSFDELLLGRLARPLGRLGITPGPTLFCGPLLGQGRCVLWPRDGGARDLVRESLLDAIERYAEQEGLNLAFAKLPLEEVSLCASLAARGFAQTLNWPVSVLDIRWDSFGAWLESLGSRGANKARRECAAPEKWGVQIAREPRFEDLDEPLLALIDANQRTHSTEPLGIEQGFFRALSRHHAHDSVVTAARAGGALAGAALLLTAGSAAGGPLIGVSDDPQNRKAFTYFNLGFYAPIRWCIEHGIERLWLGAGLYEMKRRRGCREVALGMFVRHRSAPGRIVWRLICLLHRRWVRRKLAPQRVTLPPLPERQ